MAWHDGEHAVFALEEATRVIAVWADRDFQPVDRRVLLQWCLTTAASGGRLPMPGLGIEALVDLGVVHGLEDALAFVAPQRAKDEMLLFEHLWAAAAVRAGVGAVLGFFRHVSGRVEARWSDVDDRSRRFPAWIWLQRLGLVVRAGAMVVADARLLPFLLEAAPSAKLTEEQLRRRLEAQQERAAMAEDLIVQLERERLTKAGRQGLADGVERVSVHDVGAGYDVLSFEIDGTRRYIEVKSSAGVRQRFFISRNEVHTAERLGERYVLAWVAHASRLPSAGADVAWYRNPWELLNDADGPWIVSADSWEVVLRSSVAEPRPSSPVRSDAVVDARSSSVGPDPEMVTR